MIVSFVVAVADNGLIGREGGLPWHISEDLKYFKAITMGKPIVMGRKTYDSIGRPLPGRTNIVISRNPDFSAEGVKVVPSVEAALAEAQKDSDEAMVIGGAEIYKAAFDRCDRLYLTEVHAAPEGDAFFPAFDKNQWRETKRRDVPSRGDTPAYSFVVLERA